ncbi:MAG TPA: hypothetical protein VF170_17910, partial [Planctomycetaceae bacterium]
MPNPPSRGGPPVAPAPGSKPSTPPDAAGSPFAGSRTRLRRWLAVCAASLLLHAALLAVLGSILLPVDLRERIFTILASRETADDPVPTFQTVLLPETLDDRGADSDDEAAGETAGDPTSAMFAAPPAPEPVLKPESDAPGPAVRLAEATAGRDEAAKQALLRKYGGNAASEAAVNSGLRWLASIQQADGSWSFHEIGGAPDPGTVHPGTEMGATACALLAYLG